jgi:hypothetical protein
MSLSIPFGLVSLRARNASVVSVAETSAHDAYALATLVLDDNSFEPSRQAASFGSVMALEDTLRVLSCQRCGLQIDVAELIPVSKSALPKALQEMHLAQVSRLACVHEGQRRCNFAPRGGALSLTSARPLSHCVCSLLESTQRNASNRNVLTVYHCA